MNGLYLVRWGYCSEHSELFATFEEARAKYAELRSDPEAMRFGGPTIEGPGADGSEDGSDGLTFEQRAQLGELP